VAWRSWPFELRHPGGDGIERERNLRNDRVTYHQWLQFHLDRQLEHAANAIDLITDVPVGIRFRRV